MTLEIYLAALVVLLLIAYIEHRRRTTIRSTHLALIFIGGNMATAPANAAVTVIGTSIIGTLTPLQADNTLATGATLSGASWTVSDASLVTLTNNPDGTARFDPLKVGTCAVDAQAQALDPDGTLTLIKGVGTYTCTAGAGDTRSVSLEMTFTTVPA